MERALAVVTLLLLGICVWGDRTAQHRLLPERDQNVANCGIWISLAVFQLTGLLKKTPATPESDVVPSVRSDGNWVLQALWNGGRTKMLSPKDRTKLDFALYMLLLVMGLVVLRGEISRHGVEGWVALFASVGMIMTTGAAFFFVVQLMELCRTALSSLVSGEPPDRHCRSSGQKVVGSAYTSSR